MATKAELFRYQQERQGPKREKRVPLPARPVVEDGVRVESLHAGRKAGYALEDGAGQPTRKSTRGASNRLRTDGQFQAKRRVAESKPHRPPR